MPTFASNQSSNRTSFQLDQCNRSVCVCVIGRRLNLTLDGFWCNSACHNHLWVGIEYVDDRADVFSYYVDSFSILQPDIRHTIFRWFFLQEHKIVDRHTPCESYTEMSLRPLSEPPPSFSTALQSVPLPSHLFTLHIGQYWLVAIWYNMRWYDGFGTPDIEKDDIFLCLCCAQTNFEPWCWWWSYDKLHVCTMSSTYCT